jgi:hypothetical protein
MPDHCGILLVGRDVFHNGATDNHSIRYIRHSRCILRSRHAKPDGHGAKFGVINSGHPLAAH